MQTFSSNPPLQVCIDLFSNYFSLDAVYLFGSHASGNPKKNSDLDFGIITPESKLIDTLRFDLTSLGYSNIDLVDFNRASLLMQFEIVRKNQCIYVRKGFDKDSLFSLTIRMYFDFLPTLDYNQRAMLERN